MKRVYKSLKTINYRMFFAILVLLLLPTIYKTVRIYFLGYLPSDSGINIASQLQYVDLFYEIIQEALILPLFFILGKVVNDKHKFENQVKTGLIVTTLIYMVLSLFIFVFSKGLIVFMAQNVDMLEETVKYVRLETVAALFSTLTKFMLLVLITLKKDNYMYIVLVIQMLLSVVFDTFFVSNLSISLQLGVNGIALTNIIVNVILLIIVFILVRRENIKILKKTKLSFSWMKVWFHVGLYSGLESLLRNLAFMYMIVRMVNVVAEQGNYWIANNFIWNWLLLPGLALADLVKQETAASKDNIRDKTFGYISLTTVFAIIWLVSIPLWKPFLKFVMNVDEYEKVFKIVLIQTIFYLTFLFNSCIFDSTFYGRGKTQYMLIQSICIDVFYYGIMFILYMMDFFVPTLLSISLMFGIGMALDFIPTLIIYFVMLRKEGIRINFRLEKFIK